MDTKGRLTAEKDQYTIWALSMPFTKKGSPVVGSFGAQIKGVIVIEASTWKRMCAENPQLAATQFRVAIHSRAE